MEKELKLDHVLIIDNFLTDIECDRLINFYNQKPNFRVEDKEAGYEGYIIANYFDDPAVSFMKEKMDSISYKYTAKFPEIHYTEYWKLEELRFKRFKPGNWFSAWHSEHGMTCPHRILGLQIYLSTHDCGTQFFRGDVIKSEKGRLAVWPAYFTHAHRGQKCPQGFERYILSGYYNFYKKVEPWHVPDKL